MPQIKVWNGTAHVNPKAIKQWDGTTWVQRIGKYWNGTAWVDFITYIQQGDVMHYQAVAREVSDFNPDNTYPPTAIAYSESLIYVGYSANGTVKRYGDQTVDASNASEQDAAANTIFGMHKNDGENWYWWGNTSSLRSQSIGSTSVRSEIKNLPGSPSGVDGNEIVGVWISGSYHWYCLKGDKVIRAVNSSGSLITSFTVADAPMDIHFSNGYWMLDYSGGHVMRRTSSSGTLLEEFIPKKVDSTDWYAGLSFDGTNFWLLVDTNGQQKVVKIKK
jgi:hypothetical protein